jgi:hypothetical protein
MRETIASIEREYRRYKTLAESTFAVLTAGQLAEVAGVDGNSIAVIVWHVSGNLKSRFTDFLTADGEKVWRQRDSEFEDRVVTHDQLLEKWAEGWAALFATLEALSDSDLGREVRIRGEALTVRDALHRSLAHTTYHVGQIVLLGKSFRGAEWRSLSIPRRSATER